MFRLLFLILAGLCSVTAAIAQTEVTQVGNKNYTLGEEKQVYIGQPMISARLFSVSNTKIERTYIAPVNMFTFNLSLTGLSYRFSEGAEMRDVGKIEHAGKEYTLLKMPERMLSGNLLMVDENLLFIGYVKSSRKVVSAGANIFISTQPKQIQFARKTFGEEQNSSKFITNFELIYSGKTKDAVNLLYREYTPDNMARPAFSQNLTYEPDAKTIRFREIVLRVVEVTGESIRFVIEADGPST